MRSKNCVEWVGINRFVAGMLVTLALIMGGLPQPAAASGASTVPAAVSAVTNVAAPTVTVVSPRTGSSQGGTTVTITGANFVDVTRVVFGSTAGTDVQVTSASSLTVVSPRHSAGRVDVRVVTAYGTSAKTSKDRFTFVAPPRITRVSPATGRVTGGTRVKISGTRFSGIAGVTFGGVPGTGLKVSSKKRLTITTPAVGAGTVAVAVIGKYGTSPASATAKFRYIAAPTVAALSVRQGPTQGGTRVAITGTDFTKVTQVLFGTKKGAKLKVGNTTILTVVSPAGTTGVVDVRVVTSYGTSAAGATSTFTYGSPPTVPGPTITSVSPSRGSTSGGTRVTIAGSGLAGTSKVTFGGVPATGVAVSSDGAVTLATPAHAAGTVPVVLTAPGGTATKAAAFTYETPAPGTPAVTSLSVTSGDLAGGTSVTIAGSNLAGASKVLFGVSPATIVEATASSVRVLAPAHVAGTVPVRVTTPSGTSGAASGFTFVVVPHQPSAEEAQVLKLTNEARAKARTCGDESYPATPPLSWDPELGDLALAHSRDMAARNYFDHATLEGESPFKRMTLAGYSYRAAGENIAAGYPTAESVVTGWLNSPGHCANLMSASYTVIGVGYAAGTRSSSYGTYWTQDFAAR
jgi:uncharacterized protein YkwD